MGEVGSALTDALDETSSILRIAIGITSSLIIKEEVMKNRAGQGFTTVTELADTIVRERGLSFRTAHRIVGMVVRQAIERAQEANYITTQMIDDAAQQITGKPLNLDKKVIVESLDPVENITKRATIGGPAPREVVRMIAERKIRIIEEKSRLEQRLKRLGKANDTLSAAVKQLAK